MEHDLPDGRLSGWYTLRKGHVTLEIRLTPGASRDAIDGLAVLDDGRPVLAVRVRAIAERGKANAALAVLVARSVGLPKSACRVVSGAAGRRKVLRIDGDAADIAGRLPGLVRAAAGPKRR